ncbi:MAG: uracil-DNA glycosylase [Bdellovibrionales bacterium]|nr:uracil-DNA glycosylase [Bdellovibrionales bacterium]
MSPKGFPENLPPAWRERLAPEAEKDYFKSLTRFLVGEHRSGARVFPAKENVLRAIQSLDLPDVKVVILGQDPYHGEGQAIGLSFAVPNTLRPKPPSLQNIFKEIREELGVAIPEGQSDLSGWVAQGVLLLNAVLTVRANEAFSHREQGWETFTDEIIRHLDASENPIVFLLWGSAAQKKKLLIRDPRHFILESAHPSPLSAHRGFLGNGHFARTNEILRKLGRGEIRWERVSI